MKEAAFYTKEKEQKVHCYLCPHNCLIREGKRGICRVRKNVDGKLMAETYGQICSAGFDPIEKKPLYHFHPGNTIFSVGSIGCNLHCRFCQNWEISQTDVEEFDHLRNYQPDEIVKIAGERKDNFGIAYTYNEPTVWFEYMDDIATRAKDKGLKNVMVTNGFISPDPLQRSFEFMDAYSVDLKAFDEEFYRKLTASKLEPVKKALKMIRDARKHMEITNLVITGENDEEAVFEEMIKWIGGELGNKTVLHISRYYPTYRLNNPPTSPDTLERFYEIASRHLAYVYIGNIISKNGQNTYCDNCKELLIERSRYNTRLKNVKDDGSCGNCGNEVFVMN